MKIRAKNLSIITNNKLCSVPSSGLILINFVTSSANEELEIKLTEKPVIMFRKKSINGILVGIQDYKLYGINNLLEWIIFLFLLIILLLTNNISIINVINIYLLSLFTVFITITYFLNKII